MRGALDSLIDAIELQTINERMAWVASVPGFTDAERAAFRRVIRLGTTEAALDDLRVCLEAIDREA